MARVRGRDRISAKAKLKDVAAHAKFVTTYRATLDDPAFRKWCTTTRWQATGGRHNHYRPRQLYGLEKYKDLIKLQLQERGTDISRTHANCGGRVCASEANLLVRIGLQALPQALCFSP